WRVREPRREVREAPPVAAQDRVLLAREGPKRRVRESLDGLEQPVPGDPRLERRELGAGLRQKVDRAMRWQTPLSPGARVRRLRMRARTPQRSSAATRRSASEAGGGRRAAATRSRGRAAARATRR